MRRRCLGGLLLFLEGNAQLFLLILSLLDIVVLTVIDCGYWQGEVFIAKSCTSEELETLKGNAQKYSEYMCANKNSYISKVRASQIYDTNSFEIICPSNFRFLEFIDCKYTGMRSVSSL